MGFTSADCLSREAWALWKRIEAGEALTADDWGVNLRPPLGQLTEADWDTTMAVNLDAAFVLGQRFGAWMADHGWGRIINIASRQSVRAFGNSGAYVTGKTVFVDGGFSVS